MSFLSDKFNVPPETVKKMISTGVISCSWAGYEDIYKLWRAGRSIRDIATETGRSPTNVYETIQRFRRIENG